VECSGKPMGLLVVARSSAPYEHIVIRELDPVLSAFENILDDYKLDLHRKKAEEIEKQRSVELARANVELAKASKLKDEFLASMSHELRTPISGILNLNETMEEEVLGSLNENQHRYCQLIDESGKHLLSLINDILDLAKIDSNELDLRLGENSLQDIALSSIRLVSEAAKIRKQTIEFELVGFDHFGMVDRSRMIQVLVNLLSNAIKFSPLQTVINVKAQFLNSRQIARYTVSDNGIGIDADKISQLFQPFVQLDSELERDYEGTGLGLVLVKKLVNAHGGEVSVQSQIEVGSAFTVEVPFKMKQDQK
jgi:signal transduction histidine kinase